MSDHNKVRAVTVFAGVLLFASVFVPCGAGVTELVFCGLMGYALICKGVSA